MNEEDCIKFINKDLDDSIWKDNEGNYYPYVCVICDKFLKKKEARYISKDTLLEKQIVLTKKRDLHADVLDYYTYNGPGSCGLEKLLLSPKACFDVNGRRFICCEKCRKSVKVGQTPEFAISNFFEIGKVPKELEDLTDVEMAYISDVRCHSHLLTFQGGHNGIKGWHSLVKTNLRSKRHADMAIENIGYVPNKVVVVMTGEMTPGQRRIITKGAHIRRDKCRAAMDWLCLNHTYYRKYNTDISLEDVPEPIILDYSDDIETLNSNLESQEEIRVAFPDGTLSELTGGYQTVDEMKEAIGSILQGNVEARLHIPHSEYVRDFSGDNFALAFLRQFPYGYGGPETIREMPNGTRRRHYTDDYIKHVCNLSNLRFSEGLFTLVAFNLFFRQRMVSRAGWKLKSTHDIEKLTPNDVQLELLLREQNRQGAGSCSEFLNLINWMTQSLPHTVEASKRGRQSLLSMQATFGFPHIFFTISPPDDNSVIITVYSGVEVTNLPEEVTEDFLKESSSIRSKLRFQYPGLSTFNFEVIIEIVLKQVIGWSGKEESRKGYFGCPEAYFFSVEEQSRKTLHMHLLLWLKEDPLELDEMGKCLENGLDKKRNTKWHELHSNSCAYVDSVSSCHLHGDETKPIPHKCISKAGRPCKPKVQPDQMLRFLRHKDGSKLLEGGMLFCPKCDSRWTSSEFSLYKCLNGRIDGFPWYHRSNVSDGSMRTAERLNRMVANEIIYRNKLPGEPMKELDEVVNALHNTHSSLHVGTCFNDTCKGECRYYFPKQKNKRTIIEMSHEYEWYTHRGAKRTKLMPEVVIERGCADVFMNTYCKVISKSKIACNSNCSIIVNGKQGFYTCKYCTKNTQKEDTGEYEQMSRYVNRRLASTKFEEERSEAMSRVIGACLAHNSTNIISATMAKYLINNGSRFGMSHPISNVPIKNFKSIFRREQIMLNMSKSDDIIYIDGPCINYLLRPNELEDICPLEFFSEFYVKRYAGNDMDEVYRFRESHPSYKHLCVTYRKEIAVPGIMNWSFPDCASLSGDILNKSTSVGVAEEEYAEAVLLLCMHFRNSKDLMCDGSYVRKYREVYSEYIEQHETTLQNIQNIRNALKCTNQLDKLEQETEAYVGPSDDRESSDHDENIDLDEADIELMNSLVMDGLDGHDPSGFTDQRNETYVDDNSHTVDSTELCFDWQEIRNRGAKKCGYSMLAPEVPKSVSCDDPLIKYETIKRTTDARDNDIEKNDAKKKVTMADMVQLILRKTTRDIIDENIDITSDAEQDNRTRGSARLNGSLNLKGSRHVCVVANGTVESILAWCNTTRLNKKTGLSTKFDKDQKKAFVIIISHFILTYFEDAEENVDLAASITTAGVNSRSCFRREKNRLRKLAGRRDALRLFLDGPGGAGKSEVIKELLKYARSFCENIGMPFTRETILITASTGVAATLIKGETMHSACHIQCGTLTPAMKENFEHVRLLIVDEISMIKSSTLKTLDRKLRQLCDIGSYYGGKNIVFVGDFRQLEPIPGNTAIYKDLGSPEWYDAINAYIVLRGQYRFKNDPEWGAILSRFHSGNPLPSDFIKVNQRVVVCQKKTVSGDKVPAGIRYATPNNKERDAINVGLFDERVHISSDDCLLILASSLKLQRDQNSEYIPMHGAKFYKECGESDCKFPKQSTIRMDPVLKLYKGAPVMLTENLDVKSGLANGTEATVCNVILKTGRQTFNVKLSSGIQIPAVYANDVASITLKHANGIHSQPIFNLEPKQFTFAGMFPRPPMLVSRSHTRSVMKMRAVQLPVISNSATTGHKLQGSSRDALFINHFSYASNWPYVALSRVREIKGLFLREPLDETKDYSHAWQLKLMHENFEKYKLIDDQYLLDAQSLLENAGEIMNLFVQS